MFKLLLKLGWRNIFRNKRKSALTSLVIGIGLAALIFQDALFIGMSENITARATETFLGQGQVHAQNFRRNGDVENTIKHLEETLQLMHHTEEIENFSPRTISPCMLSSSTNSSHISLFGVFPEKEQSLSLIRKSIIRGNYLQNEKKHAILLGDRLAKILEVDIGEHIVATMAQAKTGELIQERFVVEGIYRIGEKRLDKGAAFILLPKAQSLLNLGDEIHEIAWKFHHIEEADNPSLPFWKKASSLGNEALNWKDLSPALRSLLELSGFATLITGCILFILVVFIIMNSLFMSLFERRKEFGILKAMGTRPLELFFLIIIEGISLAILSIAKGLLLAIIAISVARSVGINYSGIDIADVTLSKPIYAAMDWTHFTFYPLSIFVFTLIPSIYPACVAARIRPIKALQEQG